MTKEELMLIATALTYSKQNAIRDAAFYEAMDEKPALIAYLREELIPHLNEAIEIVTKHYRTSDKKIIPSIRNTDFNIQSE